MTVRVYRFGADSPLDRDLVIAQIRGAHDYYNELIACERGRRTAMRAIFDQPEIREAESALRTATKSDRKTARKALFDRRRKALVAAEQEISRITSLEHEYCKAAYNEARCYWGTRLDIAARARAARSAKLYRDDGFTPNDPRFIPWREMMLPNAKTVLLGTGQIGIQLQAHGDKITTTGSVMAGESNYVRVVKDDGARPNPKGRWRTLWLRVGSQGAEPVWARVRVCFHREIPDAARWSWVRLSVEARALHEHWSVEITVDDPAPSPRALDRSLDGAVAIQWAWDPKPDGSIIAACWHDTRGERGEVVLSVRDVQTIRKGDSIRAVRDILWNELVKPETPGIMPLPRILLESGKLPDWLSRAASTMHLWRSLNRAHELFRRWQVQASGVAPRAFSLILAWHKRDWHLYEYESECRHQALDRRREQYRLLACEWARKYKGVILSNQNLSREARFGEASDMRFTVAPDQLRTCLRNAFGDDSIEGIWDREPDWCERACAAYLVEGARASMFAERKEKVKNAWAKRKKKKLEKLAARNDGSNHTESLEKTG